jgi:hypothetical protein
MMVVDGAESHLDQPICKALFHDPGKRRGVGSRVVLVCLVHIGVCVDMKDGQAGVTPAHRAHDRMRDGVVAAEAEQRIARRHRAFHISLDEIPGVAGAVEPDVAMIDNHALDAQIDTGFAPDAVRIGMQLAADEGGCFGGAFHERGVVVMRNAQQGNFCQFSISTLVTAAGQSACRPVRVTVF